MLSEESQGCQVLIALEGPDYTGKSTLVQMIVDKINVDYAELNRLEEGPVCTTFPRPGGSKICEEYREIITNERDISSTGRQAVALIEDVMFKETMETTAPIVILDRYNPISGQVYGPAEFRDAWRAAVTYSMVLRVDRVILIDSSKDVILKRAASRDKRDAMDDIFSRKIEKYLNRYRVLKIDHWTQNYCNPVSVENNGDDFDELFERVYTHVKETIDERINTIGL